MRVRQLAVDFLDHVHRKDVAVRLAGEFVGAVRGAHRNRQRVDLGFLDELHGFIGIGQQLVVRQLAFETVAILLLAFAAFQRAEHAEFAFHRNAAEMRHRCHRLGDADIVIPVGRRFAVGLQRAIHHHRSETGLDRGHAGGGFVAVIEMHADGNVRIDFRHRVHHVLEHHIVGIGARAARGLDDDRRIDGVGGFHDRQRLLHVVDVECRHAVVVLSSMIQQLTQRDASHVCLFSVILASAKGARSI